jgi:hypothetical protein
MPATRPPGGFPEFVRAARWRAATSEAYKDLPHEYTVFNFDRNPDLPPAEWHQWAVQHIREHGYREKFGGRWYSYLEVEIDGAQWKFWAIWPVINRERLTG